MLFTALAILGGLAVAAAIIAVLTIKMVFDWYKSKNKIKDKHHVNVMLKQELENGNFKTITGVFDPYEDKIHDAKAFESKELDEDLAARSDCCVIRDV